MHTAGNDRSEMTGRSSLLDELRVQYEAVRESTHEQGDVESFQAIDPCLRKAFRWLEKAITYLDGLKPTIDHPFDLGYGFVFDSRQFARGSVRSPRTLRSAPATAI